MAIVHTVFPRPDYALGVQSHYEARAMQLAAEALSDISECDGAAVYIRWDHVFPHPKAGGDGVDQTRSVDVGKLAPVLYVLFRGVVADLARLPRLHVAPDGKAYPAHAICLASMPSGHLLEGQPLKDTVRRGVEGYLRHHNVSVASRPALALG